MKNYLKFATAAAVLFATSLLSGCYYNAGYGYSCWVDRYGYRHCPYYNYYYNQRYRYHYRSRRCYYQGRYRRCFYN